MTKEMNAYENTLGEIDLERARYLLSTDELLEEMLDENQSKITNNINLEFNSQGRTRCGELVDTGLLAEQVNSSLSTMIDFANRIDIEQTINRE